MLTAGEPVRDKWEVNIPDLEGKLSAVLGVPWKTSVDPGHVYSFAKDRFSKEHPGQMLTEYIYPSLSSIREQPN